MKILVSGSKGFIGSTLLPFLKSVGHDVVRLTRSATAGSEKEIYWNPTRFQIDAAALDGFDAVIHLAGNNIAEGRWDADKKREIRESRVNGTRLLAETMSSLRHPPGVFIQASAVGFYGDRGDQMLTEISGRGEGFLAEVCEEWEEASRPAQEKGIRVVPIRIGLVIGKGGGVLRRITPLFKFGLGGRLGNGLQYMSWISLDDLIAIFHFVLTHEKIIAPVNAVSPHPVTNREFSRVLGAVLKRPTVLPVPAWGLKLILGEMADSLLLSGARILPQQLQEAGFQFKYPDLSSALRAAI